MKYFLVNGADCEILTYDTKETVKTPQLLSMNQHYYGNHDEIEVLNEDTKPSPSKINGLQKNPMVKSKFKKGHRRAYSMPNAKGGDRAVLVVAEDRIKVDFFLERTSSEFVLKSE